jgi:hypothetical protein
MRNLHGRLPKRGKGRNAIMSLAAHHPRDVPASGRRVSPISEARAPEFTRTKTLLMQSLRMLLAVSAIAAVVIVAAGIKLAIWLPTFLR